MIDWFSKKRKEQKSKDTRERELRASLSKKLARYEDARQATGTDAAEDDHTLLMLNGKQLRVAKKQITLTDLSLDDDSTQDGKNG